MELRLKNARIQHFEVDDVERLASNLDWDVPFLKAITKAFSKWTAEQLQAGRPDEELIFHAFIQETGILQPGENLKLWVQRNADRLLHFEGKNGEGRYVEIRCATEEHLRGHLRMLRKQAGRRRSKLRLQADLKYIAFFEGMLEVAVPSFREGAQTLPEAIMLATATTTSSYIQ